MRRHWTTGLRTAHTSRSLLGHSLHHLGSAGILHLTALGKVLHLNQATHFCRSWCSNWNRHKALICKEVLFTPLTSLTILCQVALVVLTVSQVRIQVKAFVKASITSLATSWLWRIWRFVWIQQLVCSYHTSSRIPRMLFGVSPSICAKVLSRACKVATGELVPCAHLSNVFVTVGDICLLRSKAF